jgi:AraC family transcriptional regulator of adaptative response / DNA-3-methyladenine glycosylase II
LVDNLYEVGFTHQDSANILKMRIENDAVHCEVDGDDTLAAHKVALRILNLRQDPITFERQASDMGFTRLFEGRHGLRIAQTPTVFDGVIWVILGQQVNFKFAATMRRRLTELAGTRKGDLICTPDAAQVARLDEADLLKIQFSRQKADYLLNISRQNVDGKLDLESLLTQSATRVSRTLLGIRGFGVWSTNYLMMRTFGFADCVPLGDTGISSGLKNLLALDHRPKADEVAALMKPFTPYRSLASYHLWRGFS